MSLIKDNMLLKEKISVAVAIYNGEKFILEQMESIRRQTVKIDEVIFVDDCSSDRSIEIAKKYIENNHLENSWKIYCNEYNLGYAKNFRKATLLTSGDFIFFCDQDDIWYENRIEKMIQIMKNNPDILLLSSKYDAIYEEGAKNLNHGRKLDIKQSEIIKVDIVKRGLFLQAEGCTMCFRRKLLEIGKDIWYPGWAHDDFVWKLSVVLDKALFWNMPTLRRRFHKNNVTNNFLKSRKKREQYFIDSMNAVRAFLDNRVKLKLDSGTVYQLERYMDFFCTRYDFVYRNKIYKIIRILYKYFSYYEWKRSILRDCLDAIKNIIRPYKIN